MNGLGVRRRSDEGAAAVEFALVSMLLVMLLVGIIQFGYLFYQWNEITHAAREGARWAALEYDADEVKVKVISSAPGMGLTAADIAVSPENPTITDVGDPATVTVTHDVPIFVPLMDTFLGGSEGMVTLSSTATLRIE